MECKDNVVYTCRFSPVKTKSGDTYFNIEDVCASIALISTYCDLVMKNFGLTREFWFN